MPVIHPTQEAMRDLNTILAQSFFFFRNHLEIKKEYFYCILKEPAVDFIYSVKQGKSDKYQVPFPVFSNIIFLLSIMFDIVNKQSF